MLRRMVAGGLFLVLLASGAAAQGVDQPAPAVDPEAVQSAVDAMRAFLRSRQTGRGDWEEVPSRDGYAGHEHAGKKKLEYGGRTALVTLALLYGGEDPESDCLQKALKFLSEVDLTGTYATSLRASVWSKIYDPKVRPLLARDATWLTEAMTKTDGSIPGFFSYMRPCPGYGDHSNTQYGVLGLRDGAIHGLEIPVKYWQAILNHMIETQGADGGWGYGAREKHPAAGETYGNMTVGGLANLYIAQDMIAASQMGRINCRSKKHCRLRKKLQAIEDALAWLDKNLPVDFGLKPKSEGTPNPTNRGHGMGLYYLYGLERCAHASGRKTFGGLNWFDRGAQWILNNMRQGGSFHSYRGPDIPTSWALLFLSKGRAPIYYNKLDTGADWNIHPRDVANLSKFIGREVEQRINWQVVDVDDAPETWLDAPILFFNGTEFPEFTDEQKRKLRVYTDSGGTLVAEAACSSREFVRGFTRMARELWPEWELEKLDTEHPVMTCHHKLRRRLPGVLHIHDGCRSRVLLFTKDMSCPWNYMLVRSHLPDFQFGMNLARYATDGRQIRDRLSLYKRPVLREPASEGKPLPEPGASEATVTVADYPTDGVRSTAIRGMRHLAELLDEASAVTMKRPILEGHKLDGLDEAQVLHMSGLHTFSVSDENLAKLRAFIERGGLILADAQCGREGFQESFVRFTGKLAPGAELQPVPKDDAVLTGKGLPRDGFDVTRVEYKRALRVTQFLPVLKEIRLDGRRVVLYSPYDLTVGLDGMDAWGCKGPVRNDCLKIAANVVLSALPADAEESAESEAAEPEPSPEAPTP